MPNLTTEQARKLGIKIPASAAAHNFRTIRSAKSNMRAGDSTTPRPRIDPDLDTRIVRVEVEARNPLNSLKHWRHTSRVRNEHRLRTASVLLDAPGTLPPLPARVTMTRYAPGTLDEWDGLPASLKSIVDGVAEAYACNDDDPRFEWAKPKQVKTTRGVWFVTVNIEHVADAARREGTTR